jgi:hypothetical protein
VALIAGALFKVTTAHAGGIGIAFAPAGPLSALAFTAAALIAASALRRLPKRTALTAPSARRPALRAA